MNEYEIIKIYEQMERELIRSMTRNLKRHQKEEEKVGFKFSQWQAEKLRSLQQYRKENKHIIEAYTKGLDKNVAGMLSEEMKKGKLEALKGYEKAVKEGYKAEVDVPAKFFKTNSRKANTFIKVINNDLKKANNAALRRSNDIYREVIHKASTFVSNGVYTERQAVDMAIKEFKEKGINCIVYKNGARHTISDYSGMAIRTANQRATLMAEGEFRKKIGETLVIVSKHGTACKICQEFENRVFIDDVYSGGTAEDGNYPLLSQAMKEGMFHPNCRHGLNTYYEGITEVEPQEEPTTIEAYHVTNEKAYKNILTNGFDLSKAGTSGGTAFGNGVYFTNGDMELQFYKGRFDSDKFITAEIDTTGFMKVTYKGYVTADNMFEPIIEQFTEEQKEEYKKILKELKANNKLAEKDDSIKYVFGNLKSEAAKRVLEKHYAGLEIIQTTPKIDAITGGNQIVVFDLDRIKVKDKLVEEITEKAEKVVKQTTPRNIHEIKNHLLTYAQNVNLNGITNKTNLDILDTTLDELNAKYPTNKLYEIKLTRSRKAAASANYTELNLKKDYFNREKFEHIDFIQRAKDNLKIINKRLEEAEKETGRAWEQYKKKLLKMKKFNEESLKYTRYTVTYKGLEIKTTITHEYGHIIADQYIGQTNKGRANRKYFTDDRIRELNRIVDEAFRQAKRTGDIYKISQYASSNTHEFFAETFVIYEIGKEKLPDYIIRMIEGVIRYGKKSMR